MLDETHVLFSAGNYIQIFNVDTKKLTYLPTVGGKGIGSIAVSSFVFVKFQSIAVSSFVFVKFQC